MIRFKEIFVLLIFLLIIILSIDSILCYFGESGKKVKRYLALLEFVIIVLAIWMLVT
jgi:hypothetical protein